jgi:hypothetical protein
MAGGVLFLAHARGVAAVLVMAIVLPTSQCVRRYTVLLKGASTAWFSGIATAS